MSEIRTIEANGLRFAYLEEGEGPLVLLLHGFPDTPQTWDAVRPALSEAGYRAVSPFMRGYAPSAIPADGRYDGDTLGMDALGLIEALGERRAIVIGHDWGAFAAYSAAAQGPEKLRLLVTVAIPHPASVRPEPRMVWGARHFLSLRMAGAAARISARNLVHIDELVQRWSPAWKVPPEETAAVKEAFRQPGCLEAALGYYRAVSLIPPKSIRSRIGVPTVSFSGADDGILTEDDFEKARRCFTGRYQVVHMPGGHFMHREHPERFIRELLRVLPSADR